MRAYRLAVDEYSGQVRFLLPLTSRSRVLQMRSGWGSVALNVAGSAASVVALDDRPERLRFLAARRDEAGIDTLETRFVRLGARLPFEDGEFDAVIMLDALEHVGVTHGVFWRSEQQQALEEAYRVLKPKGQLLLAVPNKLGFARPQSDEVEKLQTYSGYRNTLRRAGFRRVAFHAPLPSHREPFFILPLGKRHLLNHFVDWIFTAQDYRSKLQARGLGAAYRAAWGAWRTGRKMRMTGLAKYIVPSYLIKARK